MIRRSNSLPALDGFLVSHPPGWIFNERFRPKRGTIQSFPDWEMRATMPHWEAHVMIPSPPLQPNTEVFKYMPGKHVEAFQRAAGYFKVWILVRRGNAKSLKWIGQFGYIPKMLDCKAKTADQDVAGRECAGLVASPELLPDAFGPDKRVKAKEEWDKFVEKLYYFDPQDPQKNLAADTVGKHYTVQLDTGHKHYGCVMYKPVFRAQADYIHADYDLYAIVPAANPSANIFVREKHFGDVKHSRSQKLYDVQYFLKAAGILKDAECPNVPMIRHGEQETFKTDICDDLDVFWPDGKSTSELKKGKEIEDFYTNVLEGRKQVNDNTVPLPVQGKWVRT
jgi:hypothetical protein